MCLLSTTGGRVEGVRETNKRRGNCLWPFYTEVMGILRRRARPPCRACRSALARTTLGTYPKLAAIAGRMVYSAPRPRDSDTETVAPPPKLTSTKDRSSGRIPHDVLQRQTSFFKISTLSHRARPVARQA